uniref:NADH pyrophosphatase-like N-terminal domain-containing protein n=1 Tax=Poecilia mexicana TaxID=48701 RepID=A0A3B3XMA4_9TELE
FMYINKLKENDAACLSALQNGHIFLFHRLMPLLQCSQGNLMIVLWLYLLEVQSVLHKSGSDGSLLKESILIGCSEQNHAQFCLDVGKSMLDSFCLSLQSLRKILNCKGTFMDLRKAFFLLEGAEAPLVAKAQALLRWHQINRFCGATGQLTQRNQAGSQRACSSSSIVYYPKVTVDMVIASRGGRPPDIYTNLQ